MVPDRGISNNAYSGNRDLSWLIAELLRRVLGSALWLSGCLARRRCHRTDVATVRDDRHPVSVRL